MNTAIKPKWECDGDDIYTVQDENTLNPIATKLAVDHLESENAQLRAVNEKLVEALEQAKFLAAHGIGATAYIADPENSKRNVSEVRRIHALIDSALAEAAKVKGDL